MTSEAHGGCLLSTSEAARRLGSSRQHVVNLCTRGELPFVWVGRHRRIRQSDVERLLGNKVERLTRDQEKSLWLHRAILARLAVDPESVLEIARNNAHKILLDQTRDNMTSRWLREWLRVLDDGVDSVAEVLTSASPRAVELRQNSPFAGALPEDIRLLALAAFTKHWQEEHSRRDHAERPAGAAERRLASA
jgi:excisionase family DNA binding protein